MTTKTLSEILETKIFDYETAKTLSRANWRGWKASFPLELQNEIELFFQFVEGLIHQVEDGFVGKGHDAELYEDLRKLVEKLLKYEMSSYKRL